MSNVAIETKNLTKHYKNVKALVDLSIQVKKGSLFGFIGPNGAGKSTTIRVLCGLLRPTSGTALVEGIDVTRYPARVKSIIGYMPEDFGTYDRMRVVEYMDFFAAAHQIPVNKRNDALEKAMWLAGVTHMRDYFMGSLSRGMRQRVALAKTFVHDPQILILDEPTSALDPYARIEVRRLLKSLATAGKTILISSHILSELAPVCDEVGILQQGKLLAFGPVNEIMAKARQETRVEIELLGPGAPAARLVSAQPGVGKVEVADNMVRFAYTGKVEAIPDILKRLVVEGHRVVWMREVEADLENVFITITQQAAEAERQSAAKG